MSTIFTPTKVRSLKRGDEMWHPNHNFGGADVASDATLMVLRVQDERWPDGRLTVYFGEQSGAASVRYRHPEEWVMVVTVTKT